MDMRRTLPLTSELGTDNNTCRNVNVMSDNALRVNDDTAEMRKIEALADISVIRDLEMILTAQPVESVIADSELKLKGRPWMRFRTAHACSVPECRHR